MKQEFNDHKVDEDDISPQSSHREKKPNDKYRKNSWLSRSQTRLYEPNSLGILPLHSIIRIMLIRIVESK